MPPIHAFRILTLLIFMATAPLAWSATDDSPAMPNRLKLADAFSRKDLDTISTLVSDPWSGLRFFTVREGNDDFWKDLGKRLREAEIVSTSKSMIIYTIPWNGKYREIEFLLIDERWVLDLNSFLGPFPTRVY